MDSPALNTRSKTGPAAGVKPMKMAALGDVSNAQQPGGRKRKMGAAAGGAGSKPKHNSSAADARREAAAERRKAAEEAKKQEMLQKRKEREERQAERAERRKADKAAAQPTGVRLQDQGRSARGGAPASARGGAPVSARGGAPARGGRKKPASKAPGLLPERNPYDYKNRLADLEGVLADMVRTGSAQSTDSAGGDSPVPLEANVNKLSDKQKETQARVDALEAELKEAHESKATELAAAEQAKAEELEALKGVAAATTAALKEQSEATAAALRAEAATATANHAAQTSAMEAEHAKAIAALESQRDAAQAEVQQLRTQLTGKETEIGTMRGTIETQASSLMAVKAQSEATSAELDSERQAHKASVERAEAAEATVAQHEGTIAEMEAQAKEDEKLRKKMHNTIQELKGNIRVYCRIRPSPDEEAGDVFDLDDGNSKALQIQHPEGRENASGERVERAFDFSYDHVFGPASQQDEVFEEISQLVQSALDGYKVCIFCYGQTGSGKTYTMQGPEGSDALVPGSADAGMIPRSCEQIFDTAKELGESGWSFTVTASFLEIYNESLIDLLGAGREKQVDKLEIKLLKGKGATHVPGLTHVEVESASAVYELLERASAVRSTAATAMNERSSRSHSVFQLKITGVNAETGEKANGVLNLVDLAGSERLSSSKASGERKKETQAINKSLSSLGDCICALANGDAHVPYRNSRLTHYLQPYLGGEAKTLMFVNVASDKKSFGESLCSLRFAQKVNACDIGTARRGVKVELN